MQCTCEKSGRLADDGSEECIRCSMEFAGAVNGAPMSSIMLSLRQARDEIKHKADSDDSAKVVEKQEKSDGALAHFLQAPAAMLWMR